MAAGPYRIPLSRPDIDDEDVQSVIEALRSLRLSLGPKLHEFEEALASFVGAPHAVAVSSGTAALHLSLLASGIGPGDEVLTTPFSFVASTSCIFYVGAQPVFVDIDEKTLNLDPSLLERALTSHTRAILPVHVFGRPCEMNALMNFAQRHQLEVIEDACEAIGSRFLGRSLGTFGRAGAFGFYPNKQMTMGEGGAIVTSDAGLADQCRSLRNHGSRATRDGRSYDRLGYNYRITELQCALGLSQLRRLPELMARRTEVASWYRDLLSDVEEIILPAPPASGVDWSCFAFVVRLGGDSDRPYRGRILQDLRTKGIECSDYFPAIHLLPFVRERLGSKPGDFPACEKVAARCIALPFSSSHTHEEVEQVAAALRASLAELPSCGDLRKRDV